MTNSPKIVNKYISSGNKLLSVPRTPPPAMSTVPKIKYFDKKTFEFKGEVALVGVQIRYLKKIFELDNQDLMLISYPVTTKQKKYMQRISGLKIDLKKYDYFLEC